MIVTNLYNNVYRMLSNSEAVLNYLQIDSSLLEEELLLLKARKIQKRSKPQNLTEYIPLITFYTPPGGRIDTDNYLVYSTPVVFDVYTTDNVDLAHNISSSLVELFNNKFPIMCGLESYETKFLTAYESSVDQNNVYCFTTVIEFSVTV
ncbi:hypothetical protein SAMN05446037_100686 [Anaerovirgula multivorans]|uniref:Uncharacterized protein n=1 Tax=Anaerovirgula multivorans TaxID=312168 RepID=A0A239CR21_9FIRM|nr:hypothetical protein [Anaerovirgula multivorans]SNS22101.1 hypothetical protein SAMN05446037_100686 [Anaerovirgula multivorans]